MDLPQLDLHLLAQPAVERAERLVEQQHARVWGERAGQRHALLLAAGKLVRVARLEARKPHHGQHLAHARGDLAAARAAHLEAEADVSLNRAMREQRIGLEHHADVAPVRGHVLHRLAVEQDAAFVQRHEAGDGAQERRLARTGGPEQTEELAVADLEAHRVQRPERAVEFRRALDADTAHRRSSPPKR